MSARRNNPPASSFSPELQYAYPTNAAATVCSHACICLREQFKDLCSSRNSLESSAQAFCPSCLRQQQGRPPHTLAIHRVDNISTRDPLNHEYQKNGDYPGNPPSLAGIYQSLVSYPPSQRCRYGSRQGLAPAVFVARPMASGCLLLTAAHASSTATCAAPPGAATTTLKPSCLTQYLPHHHYHQCPSEQ